MYFITPTIVQWCDVFTRDRYKNIFVDSLNYCITAKGLRVHAWVLMTNHAHLIISTESEKMEHILRDLKKFTAKAIVTEIRENGMESRDWLLRTFEYEGKRNSNNVEIQFWQHNNHPIELWNDMMLKQKFKYIHENPVRAGFVASPEHWLYSSAVDYAGGIGFVKIEKVLDPIFDL
jgi:REP element-mobilizing transposase RayT